jgi:hypothetical protein
MGGEHLDIVDDPFDKAGADSSAAGRRFVGVHFTCCDVYTRVYVNREQTAYEGNCPKCAKRVRLPIGPGGTDSRFFTAR